MNYAVLTTAKQREVHMHRLHNLDNFSSKLEHFKPKFKRNCTF